MRVVVLSGGRSSEHEVSLRSGASVAAGLRRAGHETVEVVVGTDGRWMLDDQPLRLEPGAGLLEAEAVFPVLHGPFGEDGVTQGALETLGLPYVGSDVLSSAICMDKLTLKRLFGFHAIPQVEFVQVGEDRWRERVDALRWPVWVKPSRLGSSVGITRVAEADHLQAAVEEAAAHDPRVIIEASAIGREVECSVLGNLEPVSSLPGEIVADAEWYDYEAKYTEGGMELSVPAPIGEGPVAEVRSMAERVFALAGCSGLARCDFFVEPDGAVLVNEINTIPGFTETSVYAKLFEASGIEYPDLCDRLLDLALERHRRESGYRF